MTTFIYNEEEITVGDDNWKEYALSFIPFDGDFGDGTTLSDTIVKARNTKKLCNACFSVIKPGTFNRVITESSEGKLQKYRFCEDCCTAYGFEDLYEGNVQYDDYDDEAFEAACVELENGEWKEPELLYDVRERVSYQNREFLESKFDRWFDLHHDILHKALVERDEEQKAKDV